MTQETNAMRERITQWLPRAKIDCEKLTAQIETLSGTAKKTVTKQRDELQHQIDVLNRELEEPDGDTFTENSLGNTEMGLRRYYE